MARFFYCSFVDAYKDNYISWKETTGKVVRPNIECTNGIIHTVDTVMIDDAPPWAVGAATKSKIGRGLLIAGIFTAFLALRRHA